MLLPSCLTGPPGPPGPLGARARGTARQGFGLFSPVALTLIPRYIFQTCPVAKAGLNLKYSPFS